MSELLHAALAGYRGEPCGGMWSSPVWLAHQGGLALRARAYPEPTACRMSRGYSVRCVVPIAVDGARDVVVKFSGDRLERVDIVE